MAQHRGMEKYVKKGTQVYIEGRLRTRSWDDQNGNKRYVTEIVADTLQLLGRKPEGQQSGYQQQAQPYQQSAQPAYQQPGVQQQPAYQQPVQPAQPKPVVEDMPEDDLPF